VAKRDYYQVLGISRDASKDEIKRAYRTLAKKFHPDRNRTDPHAADKFKEVQEAYDALSDEKRRSAYDRFGHAGPAAGFGPDDVHFSAGPHGERVYQWSNRGGVDPGDLEDIFTRVGGSGDIFEELFGRGRGRTRGASGRRPRPAPSPQDVEYVANLSFDQAIHGTTIDVDVSGIAGDPDSHERLTVRIPPGVRDGQRIRLKGKGQAVEPGGPRGDLYIVSRVRPHPYFERIGDDIYLSVPISITEACLGAKVDVPTLHDTTRLTIPPGTASGTKLRLKGRGVKRKGSESGDQYVVVRIVAPRKLDPESKKLVESLQDRLKDEDPRRDVPWRTE
jgi:DnaJ-class molecular chaperone